MIFKGQLFLIISNNILKLKIIIVRIYLSKDKEHIFLLLKNFHKESFKIFLNLDSDLILSSWYIFRDLSFSHKFTLAYFFTYINDWKIQVKYLKK